MWVICDFKKNSGSRVNSAVCRFCDEKKCKVAKDLPMERVAKFDKSIINKNIGEDRYE
jgi:hypothetical protein